MIGSLGEMSNFEKLRGFDNGQTDGQTDGRTFAILESLSRLKKNPIWNFSKLFRPPPPYSLEIAQYYGGFLSRPKTHRGIFEGYDWVGLRNLK